MIKTGEPVVTTSARDDARMADYLSVHQLMLQSVACVPIRARSGEVIGALYLETRLGPAVTFTGEIPTLMAFSDQVAIAIETARLVSENEERAKALAAANEELEAARKKLEELLGHRTAQLAATRRDLRSARKVLRGHFGYEGLVGTSEAMRDEVVSEIRDELNVKRFEVVRSLEGLLDYRVVPNFRALGPRLGQSLPRVKALLEEVDGSDVRSAFLAGRPFVLDVDGTSVELSEDDVEIRAVHHEELALSQDCLLYTSDAADE